LNCDNFFIDLKLKAGELAVFLCGNRQNKPVVPLVFYPGIFYFYAQSQKQNHEQDTNLTLQFKPDNGKQP